MKTRSTLRTIFKLIKIIFFAAIILFDIWFFASWFNIGFNNSSPELIANQWSWNFFNVFVK